MSSFGKQLKQTREQRGISLEEISQSTKISTRFLHALEDEHLNQLPGGIFNKGFIRAYARHLGLDEEEIIAEYLAFINPQPAEKKPDGNLPPPVIEVRPAPPDDGAGTLPWGIFAVALLIVALIFAAWNFYSREKQRTSRPAPAAAHPTETAATPPPTTAPIQAAVMPASTGRVISPSLPAAAAPASSGALTLLLRVNEDSWLSITIDGKEIARGMFTGPMQRTIRADKEIVVKAGNVGALDFEFNGRKVPPQGDFDEVKTLIFDAGGLRSAPATVETPGQQP